MCAGIFITNMVHASIVLFKNAECRRTLRVAAKLVRNLSQRGRSEQRAGLGGAGSPRQGEDLQRGLVDIVDVNGGRNRHSLTWIPLGDADGPLICGCSFRCVNAFTSGFLLRYLSMALGLQRAIL